MSFTYDLATDAGKVRLLATDTDEQYAIFEDDEIAAFLTMEDGVRRAAALALETIARSEALLQKKIEVSNLKTDGPALAKELRESAAALRAQADAADALDEAGDDWDWAELVTGPFTERERLRNQLLRGI